MLDGHRTTRRTCHAAARSTWGRDLHSGSGRGRGVDFRPDHRLRAHEAHRRDRAARSSIRSGPAGSGLAGWADPHTRRVVTRSFGRMFSPRIGRHAASPARPDVPRCHGRRPWLETSDRAGSTAGMIRHVPLDRGPPGRMRPPVSTRRGRSGTGRRSIGARGKMGGYGRRRGSSPLQGRR
jgi:hypothetical protein